MAFPFNVPDWNGKAIKIDETWRLTKGRHVAACALFMHPTRRVELRCEVDGELRESRADDDVLTLLDLAQEWKAQFQEKVDRLKREWTL